MTAPRGKQLWVWQEVPGHEFPAGYDGVIVKVADGLSTATSAGFDWAQNLQDWVRLAHPRAVHAWAVPYLDDGQRFGHNIAPFMGGVSSLVLDVEDFNNQRWTDATLTAVVEGCRAAMPRVSLGYSSYPTAKQCEDHSINQPLLDRLTDFAVPQVYFPYQVDAWAEVKLDHRHPIAAVSPNDDAQWRTVADDSLTRFGAVSVWRCGVAGWADWPARMEADPVTGGGGGTAVDPMRPENPPASFPARFVAWDGTLWWLTDAMVRRPVTEEMARGLAGFGVPVVRWPHCAQETALLHVG